jgi:dTDP-4-amino-4,6-dideoxygalactose transaminase
MANLALNGGSPAKQKPFPLWPHYDDSEKKALYDVLESRIWWRTPGTKTLEFEQAFAQFHGAKYGIAVTNGTAALEVTMSALGICPGDEVIIPDYTFVATASAVLYAGAIPVTVDVSPHTYCLDPQLAEVAITSRTKAIIAVHMGGHPADLDALADLAARKNLALVEDCSHAHASEWKGRRIGTFGTAGTFSFQSSKLMTAGEGGIIVTNDASFEKLARSVQDCGRMPGQWFYSHFINGSNYRLSEWQGAVLSAQLSRLDSQTDRRHRNARLLDTLLSQIPGITPQKFDSRCTRNGHYAYIFHVNAREFASASIERLREAIHAEGIPTQASYPPIHQLDVFKNSEYRKRLCASHAGEKHPFLQARYPNTLRAAFETIWIPQPALLGDDQDMHEIAGAWQKVQKFARELV